MDEEERVAGRIVNTRVGAMAHAAATTTSIAIRRCLTRRHARSRLCRRRATAPARIYPSGRINSDMIYQMCVLRHG